MGDTTYRRPPVGSLSAFEREVILGNTSHVEVNRRLIEAGLEPINPRALGRMRQVMREQDRRSSPGRLTIALLEERSRLLEERAALRKRIAANANAIRKSLQEDDDEDERIFRL